MNAPIIGVTPSGGDNDLGVRAYAIAADYTMAVQRAGGIPVILPLHITELEARRDTLDGVLCSGDGDIDPGIFNQETHETTGGIDAERDTFEIALMRAAFARDMPILAICRGIQVMNVERGGDLVQDIPSQTDSTKKHNQRAEGAGEHDIFQQAVLDDGENPVAKALGSGEIQINSFHHQALGTVPDSLKVVARGDDGIIEAVYAPDATFALGTQWHPERLAAQHAEQQALFDGFVTAAKDYANR